MAKFNLTMVDKEKSVYTDQ